MSFVDELPEQKIRFSVCIDQTDCLSNDYIGCWAYTESDAVMLVACNYIQELVREMKGLACLGDVSIKYSTPSHCVIQSEDLYSISGPVKIFIRERKDDDAECHFPSDYNFPASDSD